MHRLTALGLALAVTSCTEDLGPVTKQWSDTLAGLQGQVAEVTRATNEFKARAGFAQGTEPETKALVERVTAATIAAEGKVATANAALTQGAADVQAAIAKGKVAHVQAAVDKAKAAVTSELDAARAQLKSVEAAITDYTTALAKQQREAAADAGTPSR